MALNQHQQPPRSTTGTIRVVRQAEPTPQRKETRIIAQPDESGSEDDTAGPTSNTQSTIKYRPAEEQGDTAAPEHRKTPENTSDDKNHDSGAQEEEEDDDDAENGGKNDDGSGQSQKEQEKPPEPKTKKRKHDAKQQKDQQGSGEIRWRGGVLGDGSSRMVSVVGGGDDGTNEKPKQHQPSTSTKRGRRQRDTAPRPQKQRRRKHDWSARRKRTTTGAKPAIAKKSSRNARTPIKQVARKTTPPKKQPKPTAAAAKPRTGRRS